MSRHVITCRLPARSGARDRLRFARCRLYHLGHKAEWLTHLLYLGLVGYEAHHAYAYAAWGAAAAVLLAHLGGSDA